MISPYIFPGIRRTDLPVNYTRLAKQTVDREEIQITSELILAAINEIAGVNPDEVKGRIRSRKVVTARHIYCFYARTLLGHSLNEIGGVINRDHTTIMYALKSYQDHYLYEPPFQKLSSRIKHLIFGMTGDESVSL